MPYNKPINNEYGIFDFFENKESRLKQIADQITGELKDYLTLLGSFRDMDMLKVNYRYNT